MDNEIRYYLDVIKAAVKEPTEEEMSIGLTDYFKPTYLVTAVKLPTGAIELAVNTESIAEKLDYITEAYDENMHLKTNPEIQMVNMMVV